MCFMSVVAGLDDVTFDLQLRMQSHSKSMRDELMYKVLSDPTYPFRLDRLRGYNTIQTQTNSDSGQCDTITIEKLKALMDSMTANLSNPKPTMKPGDTFWYEGKERVVLRFDLSGMYFVDKQVVNPPVSLKRQSQFGAE